MPLLSSFNISQQSRFRDENRQKGFVLMKKILLPLLMSFPALFLTAFASPFSLSLFQSGISVLDKLFLIGLGVALLGILFLCIAFCKPKKEKPIESPFDDYLEEDTQETSSEKSKKAEEIDEPTEESKVDDNEAETTPDSEVVSDKITEESATEEEPTAEETPEETMEETPEEIQEEVPEEILAETEPVSEEISEEILEDTPEEIEEIPQEKAPEIIYPKLILTNVQTNDFVILPLYPETTVGRKTDNDLVISDVTISGLHCKILNENGVIYAVDENSTNGTFVNDERISEKTKIHHGDKLTLGKREFNISVNE